MIQEEFIDIYSKVVKEKNIILVIRAKGADIIEGHLGIVMEIELPYIRIQAFKKDGTRFHPFWASSVLKLNNLSKK